MAEPLTPDRLEAVRERQGWRAVRFDHRPCWADVGTLLDEVGRLREALAAEREACARVVAGWKNEFTPSCCGVSVERTLERVEDAIRFRGTA